MPELFEGLQAIYRQGKEERRGDGEKNTQRERMKRVWGRQNKGKNMRGFHNILFNTRSFE